tara:strand:- start:14952 stop:16778 length:1827 start_codon:yes stop_codon:yes gene_type:complete
MTVLRRALSTLVISLSVACGGTGVGPAGPGNGSAPAKVTVETRAQLVIPPGETSLDAMRSLEKLSDAGSVEAAVLHAHYLMDLFDDARFSGGEESRSLLAEIAGRPKDSMRGPAATQALAELLVLDADRVLELDRKDPIGQELRVLASYDAAVPANRADVLQAMEELKRIRDKRGKLADNATLRLFGYCRSALLDAQKFDRVGQRVALSHCLYPLFASDPAPYFAEHSTERPPPPQVEKIAAALSTLLATRGDSRLAASFETQRAWAKNFSKSPGLLSQIDPLALRLPSVALAQPYDDAPIFTSESPSLGREILADGRGHVAVALASETPAAELLTSAKTISAVGGDSVLLLVATSQRLRVPRGDYWSDSVSDAPIWRVGQLSFSLARLDATKNNPGQRTEGTKAAEWNAQHSDLTLHLIVSPSQWTLLSPLGRIAQFAVGDKDASAPEMLQDALLELRSAYPDEQGIILVPEGGTSVGALTLAAEAAHHRADGIPLFPRLALAEVAPKVRKGKQLEARVSRRAGANVSVNPEALTNKVPAAVRCYQAMADARALPTASVRLERSADGKVSATGGTKKLQACATETFAEEMLAKELRAAEVQFNAKAK